MSTRDNQTKRCAGMTSSIILTAVRGGRKPLSEGFHFLTSGGHKSAAEASAAELKLNVTQRNAADDRSGSRDDLSNAGSSLTTPRTKLKCGKNLINICYIRDNIL